MYYLLASLALLLAAVPAHAQGDPYAFPLPLNQYVQTVYEMLLRALAMLLPFLGPMLAVMVGLGLVRKLINIVLK